MLTIINNENLVFNEEEHLDRVHTTLKLYDYDWMNYHLSAFFREKKLGLLNIEFIYCGVVTSRMIVTQVLNDKKIEYTYEYSSDIFINYLKQYMTKHIKQWEDKYAFNDEEIVIEFYNKVIKEGKMIVLKEIKEDIIKE